jgi:Fe-S-cluster containining protein
MPNSDAQSKSVELEIKIPEGIAYNCQGCGRCCSGWSVGLTEEDYAKVKDIPWQTLHPDLADKELFVNRVEEFKKGLSSTPYYTNARPDGSCPFLIENLCFIHSYLGEESKPAGCQLFPYTFTDTPDGIYAGVVYSSMAAVRNIGRPLSEQRPVLEKMYKTRLSKERSLAETMAKAQGALGQAPSVVAEPDVNVYLVTGLAISWDEYKQVEERLLNFITKADVANICQLWQGGIQILNRAVNLKRQEQDLQSIKDFEPVFESSLGSPSFFERLLLNLFCVRALVWPEIRAGKKTVTGQVNTQALLDPQALPALLKAVFANEITLAHTGKIDLKAILKESEILYSQEADEFYRRYLYLRLFSKTYFGPALAGLSVVSGFNNMVANFIVSLIYAKACAQKAGSAELQMADLYEVYFMIDRELAQLTQLDADKAALLDLGLSTPQLFARILNELSKNSRLAS